MGFSCQSLSLLLTSANIIIHLQWFPSLLTCWMRTFLLDISLPPWSRLPYLNSSWISWHDILYKQSCPLKDTACWLQWSIDHSLAPPWGWHEVWFWTTIGLIAMELCAYDAHRMKSNDSGDPLTFHRAPWWGWMDSHHRHNLSTALFYEISSETPQRIPSKQIPFQPQLNFVLVIS